MSRAFFCGLLSWLPLVLLLGAPRPAPADWPGFRGGQQEGVSSEKGLPTTWSPTENVRWKIRLPGPGTSSPAILGKRLYLTCYSGYGPDRGQGSLEALKRHLLCLDRDTGKEIWSQEMPASLPEQGSLREAHGYTSSTPAVDDERVYVFYGRSGVLAFSHEGKQLWQTQVGDGLNGWGSAASPVLVGDLVIINASVESGSLLGLDRRTGKVVWRQGGIRESWNTPIVVDLGQGKRELVLAIMGKVLAFDPASGEPLWSCATDIAWYMAPSLTARDGIVYCIGGRVSGALAIRAGGRGDVTATHRLWTIRKGSNVSSPVFDKGYLYWASDSAGVAYCLEGQTGRILYEERLERAGQVYASPVLADGKLYYVSRFGRTFVLAAGDTFRLLATNDLGERGDVFNASPAVSHGCLFLRSNRYLYCLAQD